jgi:hypothetical protein
MGRCGRGLALTSLLLLASAPRADEIAAQPRSRAFLSSIEASPELQAFLDATIAELLTKDARLRGQEIRVSLIALPPAGAPRLAHWKGDSPVYPASVPKFVYLMAAYAFRDAGRLEFDPAFDRELQAMIRHSSNRATQAVLRRLTDTQAGPRLEGEDYARFAWRRQAVKRWLEELGIRDLHTVHPTYDGGGDLYGRDVQFLEDAGVPGGLADPHGRFHNRQAMTANGTARLLALLAEDLALSPASSAEVRERMRRDPREQPYLWQRIAGGADPARSGLEVFSKTGTWGPIFADAGIVRQASGPRLALAAFLEGTPAYRGSFVADLTRAAVAELFTEAPAASGPPGTRGPRAGAPD